MLAILLVYLPDLGVSALTQCIPPALAAEMNVDEMRKVVDRSVINYLEQPVAKLAKAFPSVMLSGSQASDALLLFSIYSCFHPDVMRSRLEWRTLQRQLHMESIEQLSLLLVLVDYELTVEISAVNPWLRLPLPLLAGALRLRNVEMQVLAANYLVDLQSEILHLVQVLLSVHHQ